MTVKWEEQMIKCEKVWSTIVTVGPQVCEPSVNSCFAYNHSTFTNIKYEISQNHWGICKGVNRAIQILFMGLEKNSANWDGDLWGIVFYNLTLLHGIGVKCFILFTER